VALGVAEAIEVSINLAHLVTIPVLDARLQELRHELKTDIQMLKVELKGEMEILRSDMKTLRGEMKTFQVEMRAEVKTFQAEMKTFQAEIKAELADGLGKLGTEIQKVNANLMRWVLLTMLGSVVLNMVGKAMMSTLLP
jgi:predicted  nucleic acid-binding Zn-ribbon protein